MKVTPVCRCGRVCAQDRSNLREASGGAALAARSSKVLWDETIDYPKELPAIGVDDVEISYRSMRCSWLRSSSSSSPAGEFHCDRNAFETDRLRDADNLAAGYGMIRITWERIHEAPDQEAACLHAILAERRRYLLRAAS